MNNNFLDCLHPSVLFSIISLVHDFLEPHRLEVVPAFNRLELAGCKLSSTVGQRLSNGENGCLNFSLFKSQTLIDNAINLKVLMFF